MILRFSLALFAFSSLCAMFTGNPSQPGLMKDGIWKKYSSWWSFRVGYFDDWVYKQRFRDEFKLEGVTHTRTFLELSTYSATVTLNFKDRIDFYGLLGSSRMQLDEELFSKRAFSWGVGGKLILIKHGNFFIGSDIKYFETNQKPKFFVIDHLPYNIVSNYRLKYEEVQGSLGIAYRAWVFAPYFNATYIHTRIEPIPAVILVQLPDMPEIVDVEMKSIIGQKRWGMSMGFTLIDCCKASLAFEWRVINQNAINVFGELRF